VFGFGLRSNGFVFGMYKKLRIDNFEDDFGTSAYIGEINKNFEYILIEENNLMMEVTERIFG